MENSFQTSFIPKKPIGADSSRFKDPTSIFLIIPIIILVISVVLSILLFAYKSILVKQESNLSASLLSIKGSFEQDTIKELNVFDNRTKIARDLLDNHFVFSPMFKLLGEITIPSVQYKKFDQQTTNKVSTINIEGIARDYRSIALQVDAFNTSKGSPFKEVVFSDILKDKSNNITFKLSFNVDPSLLSYKNNKTTEVDMVDNFIPPSGTPTTILPSLQNINNKIQ